MRGKNYTIKDKEKIKQLLSSGRSYTEIMKISGVPKSTISTWFGKTSKKPLNDLTRKKHFARLHKLASSAVKRKWEEIRKNNDILIKSRIENALKKYPLKNITVYKALLSMLYWAEGSKYEKMCGTQFANTDPILAKLYITLLRKCYDIEERKFRIKLHIHYYHSMIEVKNFWAETLSVPTSQFNKTYIKKRSKTKKFRKNFAGICFIYYGNNNIKKELIGLGLELQKIITNMRP